MDEVEAIALREKPKMILAGFSAYSRSLDWKRFREIADKTGAFLFADIAHIAGLIAGKQLENPIPYCDVVSTTTHKTLRGPRGAMIMCKEKFASAIDKAIFPGVQGGPHEHIIAAKAIAYEEALQSGVRGIFETRHQECPGTRRRARSERLSYRFRRNGQPSYARRPFRQQADHRQRSGKSLSTSAFR